ncbi:MAG: RNA polymerase sigma factor [Saprospiraceae bacterium]|nr:RNA polymerase sigma factor [Saprospiraceae bacterium]
MCVTIHELNGRKINEKQLVQRCIKQDRKAQYELYQNYVDALFHTVLRIVVSRTVAEDVVQEGFVKIFRQMHRYREDGGIYAWMKRIMINEAIGHLRKQKRSIRHADMEELPEASMEIWQQTKDTRDDRLGAIHQAIKLLPTGCREVLNMYLFEGMSHREISTVLSISESTSKTQYMRAKRLIRERIGTSS